MLPKTTHANGASYGSKNDASRGRSDGDSEFGFRPDQAARFVRPDTRDHAADAFGGRPASIERFAWVGIVKPGGAELDKPDRHDRRRFAADEQHRD